MPPSISNTFRHEARRVGREIERTKRDVADFASLRIGVLPIISLRRLSSVSTTSSADVATDPTAMALTRTRGAQSAAINLVMCASAAFAVP